MTTTSANPSEMRSPPASGLVPSGRAPRSTLHHRELRGPRLGSGGNPSFPHEIEAWQISASAPYFLWSHLIMWIAPWGRLEVLGSYLWDHSIPAMILPFCWLLLVGVILMIIREWKPGNLFLFMLRAGR